MSDVYVFDTPVPTLQNKSTFILVSTILSTMHHCVSFLDTLVPNFQTRRN